MRGNLSVKILIIFLLAIVFVSTLSPIAWAAPDADVTDIYNPTSLVALQTFIVTVELFNYGTAGTIPLNMYVDGAYWTTFYIPMNEWSYGWFDVQVSGGLSAGYHTIAFCASNCRTEGWTWTGTPDLQLTDIYPPTSTVGGQDSIIKARIDNNGNANAGPFWLDMYIDGQYITSWYYSSGLPARSYSEPYVTLTGGLVAGAHNIQFTADATNTVAESNEGNNTRTETFTWTGTPDLQLTDIYPPTSTIGGQESIITARIDNIGYANAGAFYLDMYIDGEYVFSWYYSSGLPARYYSEPYITLTGGLVAGAHNIQFIVDATSAVAESNEDNNTRTETFTWTGTPDLEVTDIYDPTSIVSGTNTTIKARVTNIGYANAGAFWLDMYIDGEYVASWDFTSGLPAISYSEPYVTITGGLVDGAHNIEFIADVFNEIAESNEDNNNRTEIFTWTGGIPDLELTDIYNPTSITSGTDTTITAKLTNIGYAGANPFYLDMYIDGQYVVSWNFYSGLSAITYSEASVTLTGGLVDGTHNIEFVADSLDEVAESNEGNNNRTESFTWTGGIPDLELTDIYAPTSLNEFEDTTIKARVTNIGYGDATPFYLDLYIDGEYVASWDYYAGLPAWNYSEPSVTISGGLPAGTHSFRFVADSLNEVAESNESNNERTRSWIWVAPPPPPPCSPVYGQGIGVLGDAKSHIDTCYESGGMYYLYDVTRRAGQIGHNHGGQMLSDASIITVNYPNSAGAMYDADNVWNAANQKSGVDAHVYAAKVYDYWLSLSKGWSLNSYDGTGITMSNIVEVPTYPCPNNAYWDTDQSRVNYCVSDGQFPASRGPLSGAFDVVAHEWGHAVTDRASQRPFITDRYGNVTNTLLYEYESGALNEAFSDWMGIAAEHANGQTDWTMGEDIDMLRDLENPLNPALANIVINGVVYDFRQPDTYMGFKYLNYNPSNCTPPSNDSCGVHTNSGVPNKMFYLLAEVGAHTHPVSNIAVQGIGIEKAIKIAYRANINEWPNNATFLKALEGMVNAAEYFYGTNSNEVYQVKNAWAAVGVGTIPVIVVSVSPSGGGTVSGGGSSAWGSSATVTAVPDSGYTFVNWTENGNVVSTSASYAFTADGDRTLVANFAPAPVVSVIPTSWDFGSFYVWSLSPYKTLTVTNVGLQSLTIQSISITGTDAIDFSYIDMCTGDTLSPGWNCTIDVQFFPRSVGVKNANLSIQSNDPMTPILNVPLVGRGLNNPPTSNPGGPYSGIEGQAITLNGNGSTDSDGSIVLYEWDVNNDGTYDYTSSSPTQNHTFVQQGTYTMRLRVTDNLGATGTATTTATISDTSPTANFSGSPISGSAPLNVNFTNNSTGYDQPLNYQWDFDNNGTVDSTTQTPSYIYNNQGTYTVKLTATDADGSTNSLIRSNYISVTSGSCANPPVKIGSAYYSTLQAAYNAAVEGDVIKSQAVVFTEDLYINHNISVTIEGGYDCDYTAFTGKTIIMGDMSIIDGTAIIENIILE